MDVVYKNVSDQLESTYDSIFYRETSIQVAQCFLVFSQEVFSLTEWAAAA